MKITQLKQLIKEQYDKNHKVVISENLKYHLDNRLSLTENTFRYGSQAFLDLWHETRELLKENKITITNPIDLEILNETDLGEYDVYEGELIPLDLPMLEEDELKEVKDKKKTPPIGKPKRGGSKKFYVYVRDKGKVKKVSFGDTTGLSVKINDPKARQAFAKRHKCAQATDRTKARYWSCRIGRYWKQLGGAKNFSGFW
jgi:hypothetical protein